MRFPVVIVLPPDTADILETVTRLMDPYNVEHEVPPYKEYAEADGVARLAAHFGLPATDLDALAVKLAEKTGEEHGVEGGRLFWITTANPRGHWDGWRLDSMPDDVMPVSAVPRDLEVYDVVTPDGEWHDVGYKWDLTDAQKGELRQHAYQLIDRFHGHVAVILDCHR